MKTRVVDPENLKINDVITFKVGKMILNGTVHSITALYNNDVDIVVEVEHGRKVRIKQHNLELV